MLGSILKVIFNVQISFYILIIKNTGVLQTPKDQPFGGFGDGLHTEQRQSFYDAPKSTVCVIASNSLPAQNKLILHLKLLM